MNWGVRTWSMVAGTAPPVCNCMRYIILIDSSTYEAMKTTLLRSMVFVIHIPN